MENKNKLNLVNFAIFALLTAFFINPILGFVCLALLIIYFVKKGKSITAYLSGLQQTAQESPAGDAMELVGLDTPSQNIQDNILPVLTAKKRLEKRKKYLHIALNSTMQEAQNIISLLPFSDRILFEAGTPLIKTYGTDAVSEIKQMAPFGTYIVADNKCCDLASREVEMMANAGANAATCLGVAPIETIDNFIEECAKFDIDSMVDMMNVENPLSVLRKLKKIPDVVMLHRGVDESEFSKEKQIPYYQIKQIKGSYNILVAVAGGDTIKEIESAIFNDADIVVVWKNFYQADNDTAQLANDFLKKIQ